MDSKRIRVIVKDILDRYPLLEDDRIKLADFLAGAYNSGGGGGSQESLKLGITKGTAYEGSSGETNRLAIKKLNDMIITNGNGDKFLSDDGIYKYINACGQVTSVASATNLGSIKIGYPQFDKNYPVQLDSQNRAFVRVPWVNTGNNTTYEQATSDVLGLIKIGYVLNDKNYPVELDSDGKAYVNVPWTDEDTTYSVATQSEDGLMSKEDKTKLDGLTGAYVKILTAAQYKSMKDEGSLLNNTVYYIKG